MKPNKLTNIFLSSIVVVSSFIGCTKDFEEINTNPYVYEHVDSTSIGYVFAEAEYRALLGDLYSWWYNYQTMQNLFADLYVQYYSNIQPWFNTDRHNVNLWWADAAFEGFYSYVPNNLSVVLHEAKKARMMKHYAITQVLKVFAYQRITDYWGPIPYSSANNEGQSVPYDTQEFIYRDFIVQLDSATTTLSGYKSENAFGVHDQIYGGDVNKWITFANTLRLRIAMRISYVDPHLAKAQAEKAVAEGVMVTNDQNALLKTTINSPNPLPIMLEWNEFRMSATMESILKGFNDPRLSVFWSPAANTGLITGSRNGLKVSEIRNPSRSAGNLSTMGTRWNTYENYKSLPWEVMQVSEAWFLRAEGALNGWNMGGVTAEEAYYKGIETSLEYWGANYDQIAAYKAGTTTPIALPDFNTPPQSDISVAWSADATRHLEQIHTQKWIALFPDGWEAWAENRRTGFPKLYPVINSDNPDVPPDQLMRRMQYPPSEYNLNAGAIEDGISKLGGPDKASTRLWWNPVK
jgi:hypothetical protein